MIADLVLLFVFTALARLLPNSAAPRPVELVGGLVVLSDGSSVPLDWIAPEVQA